MGVVQPLGIGPVEKVGAVGLRLPAHGVEVRHLDRVAKAGQRLDGEVFQRADEGTRLRVGVDDEYVHDVLLNLCKP